MRTVIDFDEADHTDDHVDGEITLGSPKGNLGQRTFRIQNQMPGWDLLKQSRMAREFDRARERISRGEVDEDDPEVKGLMLAASDASWAMFANTIHPDDWDDFDHFMSNYRPVIKIDKVMEIANAIQQIVAGGDVPLDTSTDSSTGRGNTAAGSAGSSSSKRASASKTSVSRKSSTRGTRSGSAGRVTPKKSQRSTDSST